MNIQFINKIIDSLDEFECGGIRCDECPFFIQLNKQDTTCLINVIKSRAHSLYWKYHYNVGGLDNE